MSEIFSWRGGRLESDRYTESAGVIAAGDLPERSPRTPAGFRLEAPGALAERWIRQALWDVELNVVDSLYFGAGKAFGPIVFTRDFSLSGLLALNRLYPRLMQSSLHYDREVRFRAHWSVQKQCSVVGKIGWPLVRTELEKQDFLHEYRTSDITRRSDDVVWIWACHDLLSRGPVTLATPTEWRWFYDTAVRCFRDYYLVFHDSSDGLYRGQSCIVDVMMCGYQAQSWQEDPRDAAHFLVKHVDDLDNPARWRPGLFPVSLRRSLMVKAASTNALYVIAMRCLADAAGRLGLPADARTWRERADDLRLRLRGALLQGEGHPGYLIWDDGQIDRRQHVLATAFWTMSDVLDRNEARRALALYPTLDWGVPFYDPFFADNPHLYHNHACWPFADAFFHAAWQKVESSPDNLLRWACRLGRACRDGRGFREITESSSGRLAGSSHQLWSAAGFLGACLELGWIVPEA